MEAVGEIAERVKLLQTSREFRGAAIFDKVRTQHLRKLAMAAERVEYASGETIISIGERGDALYTIVSGECSVDMNGIAGGRMSAGTSFGELALITDDKTLLERTATVRAVDDCVLLRIHAQKVQPILDSISIDVPPSLTQAEQNYREESFEQNAALVYREYLLAGLIKEAEQLFATSWARWPNGGSLAYERARGLKLTKQGTEVEVCDYAEIALKNREWSVAMLRDIVRYLEGCERTEAAELVRDAARKRFPKAKDLP